MNLARALPLVLLSLGLGCAPSPEVPFSESDAAPVDEGFFDAPAPPIDRYTPPVDLGNPVRDVPVDRGAMDVARETSSVPMCPASCATSTDCDPCWGDSARVGQYCCMSGLCIYRPMGEMCTSTTGPGMPDGSTMGADASAGADGGKGTCRMDSDCRAGECCADLGVGVCLDVDLGLCD